MSPRSQICAILFADIVNSSNIKADAHKRTLASFLERIFADTQSRVDAVHAKFLGDGFMIVASSAAELASAALRVRDEFRNRDWMNDGFNSQVQIRIGLHLGTVLITGGDVAGAAVDQASRVEPVTAPNSVYCTSHFHQQLEADRVQNMVGTSVGTVPLAKNSGEAELFELEWQGVTTKSDVPVSDQSYMPTVRRSISDKERDDYLTEAFETIRSYFTRSLNELASRNTHVETRIQEISPIKFLCKIYVDGDERSSCVVRCSAGSGRDGEIQYEQNPREISSDSSYNEVIWVKDDGATIFLEALGMQLHYTGGQMNVQMEPKEAGEHLWKILAGSLER